MKKAELLKLKQLFDELIKQESLEELTKTDVKYAILNALDDAID